MIRRLGIEDAGLLPEAAGLFDRAPRPEWTERFLRDPGHHLLAAFDDGVMTGFVTGVEMTHPDKGTEMFLYELGVAAGARGRGTGTALVRALADLARERGCYGMWVLTDDGNAAARRTYQSAGGEEQKRQVMVAWQL